MDMNFISIENMKVTFLKSYKLFYFQVKKSPAPLNIPTPTPAPNQSGPVACLSGPVALELDVAWEWGVAALHGAPKQKQLSDELKWLSESGNAKVAWEC